MRRRLPQPSYANVMSTIAVFIALGGTSYAVARNSIGNAQLKRNAVTSVKVKDRSLRAGDLSIAARGSLRGARGQRGPSGPQGPAGSVASGGLSPEAWQPLGLIGGWENYAVPQFESAGFRKDKQGLVHLRGLVSQGGGLPSQSLIIAVLPPGYRPARRQVFATTGGNAPDDARIDIVPDGTLTWVFGPDQERDYTSLSGLTFWPD